MAEKQVIATKRYCGSCELTLRSYYSGTAADQGPRLIYKPEKLTNQ